MKPDEEEREAHGDGDGGRRAPGRREPEEETGREIITGIQQQDRPTVDSPLGARDDAGEDWWGGGGRAVGRCTHIQESH